MKRFTLLDICSILLYKPPCKYFANHLEVVGQDPCSFCFFVTQLITKMIKSLTIQAKNQKLQMTNTLPTSLAWSKVTSAKSLKPTVNGYMKKDWIR